MLSSHFQLGGFIFVGFLFSHITTALNKHESQKENKETEGKKWQNALIGTIFCVLAHR